MGRAGKQSEFTFLLAEHIYSIVQAKKYDKEYDLRVMNSKMAVEDERPVVPEDKGFVSKRLDEILRLVKIAENHESELLKFLDYHADIDSFIEEKDGRL